MSEQQQQQPSQTDNMHIAPVNGSQRVESRDNRGKSRASSPSRGKSRARSPVHGKSRAQSRSSSPSRRSYHIRSKTEERVFVSANGKRDEHASSSSSKRRRDDSRERDGKSSSGSDSSKRRRVDSSVDALVSLSDDEFKRTLAELEKKREDERQQKIKREEEEKERKKRRDDRERKEKEARDAVFNEHKRDWEKQMKKYGTAAILINRELLHKLDLDTGKLTQFIELDTVKYLAIKAFQDMYSVNGILKFDTGAVVSLVNQNAERVLVSMGEIETGINSHKTRSSHVGAVNVTRSNAINHIIMMLVASFNQHRGRGAPVAKQEPAKKDEAPNSDILDFSPTSDAGAPRDRSRSRSRSPPPSTSKKDDRDDDDEVSEGIPEDKHGMWMTGGLQWNCDCYDDDTLHQRHEESCKRCKTLRPVIA